MRIGSNIVTAAVRPRVALPVVATTVVGGGAAAYVATRTTPSAPEQAQTGAQSIGALERASASIPAIGGSVRLERNAQRPATSATDPASFEQLFASDGPGWVAADGTISVPLPGGRTMWLFGDTVVRLPADAEGRTGEGMVRNTAVIQDGTKLTTLAGGTESWLGDFLRPADKPEQWYWPASGIAQGNEIALFMGRVRHTQEGAPGWNFTGAGSDLVVLDAKTMAVKQTQHLPGGDGMVWGAATVDSGAHTYVYGFEQGAQPLDRFAHVARVPRGRVGHAELEFWDGAAWTKDASRSARIADGLSNQFSVVTLPDGRFAMLSQELMLGRGLTARTAPSPSGPWSEPKIVDPGPQLDDGVISYNAMAHPQFTDDGQLLVGWNRNRPDTIPGDNDQTRRDYRAAFRSVPLDAIG